MFLLQVSGYPGSGKSTLAKEISKYVDVVIIDRDVIKTAMIDSGIDMSIIAESSYSIVWALCKYHLKNNKNVIIDSPCYYKETLMNGISIAHEYSADYKYIECRTEDFVLINKRLKTRKRLLSQIDSTNEKTFLNKLEKSIKPDNNRFLVIDSSLSIESYINKVIEYIVNTSDR